MRSLRFSAAALRVVVAAVLGLVVATSSLVLVGCAGESGGASSASTEPIDDYTTDQMYTESVEGARLTVVVYDGLPILVPEGESLESLAPYDLEEGHFYSVVADVDYLYGGVAGYDGYPEVKNVESVTEVSPDDCDIPTIWQKGSGVLRIDGYAEGDILLYEYGRYAVMQGGGWVYRYDSLKVRDDHSVLLFRSDADMGQIEAGIADGVYSCAEYFLVPSDAGSESRQN